MGGFLAFRVGNYDNTAEREQFRVLCNKLKNKYENSEKLCLLIANYNIYDSELDAIFIKNDAICIIEFKNYGGKIIAQENGDWTSNENIIKGGSRKTVYQQVRINHAALRQGLRELGINSKWIKDIPAIIVFNQDVLIDNKLSGKVQAWLHITDNNHFLDKIEDVTCKSTNLSNSDIIDVAIKLNVGNYIDKELCSSQIVGCLSTQQHDIEQKPMQVEKGIIQSYNRRTPNHIFSLRPNQIFVFGTDTRGTQKYGAAGIAAKRFGAQVGVVDGPTGRCYALPTKGFTEFELSQAVRRFKQYVMTHSGYTYLVTAVGCGHAGFEVSNVAKMFKELLGLDNVMLPEQFLSVYQAESDELCSSPTETILKGKSPKRYADILELYDERVHDIVCYLLDHNIPFSPEGTFSLLDLDGNIIAEAELGIESEKKVFYPFNRQSEMAFINNGYTICKAKEYLNSKQK